MNTADYIDLAAETVDCKGQTRDGLWIYHDHATGWWIVTDDEMAELGRLAYEDPIAAYERWCSKPLVHDEPVDIDEMVRGHGWNGRTDFGKALRDAVGPAYLVLTFALADVLVAVAHADVLEVIRPNEDMARPLNLTERNALRYASAVPGAFRPISLAMTTLAEMGLVRQADPDAWHPSDRYRPTPTGLSTLALIGDRG